MADSRTVRVDILGDSRSAQKAFSDVGASADSFSSRVGNIGKAAAVALAGVGLAAGAMALDGIGAFTKFESGMNEVFTLLPGASQATFDKLTKQTKDFSREFGVLPEKTIPALYQALSAGVPADNVFAFLETAQKAAKGGVTDLETAVNGITSVVNAYGAEVMDATRASDLMFTAVRLGKTDFQQLSSSLFNVIPTAASLGVNFEDITAALARLTAQGTPTSVATTQIRAALQEAAKSGGELDTALKKLTGQSFTELIAGGQDIGTIFNTLRNSMPDEEFRNLFSSTEALSAVLGITGPQAEAFQLALAEMGNSAGATEQAFQQMDKGIAPAMERIRANIAVARIEIGERLAPIVAKLLDFVVQKLIPGIAGFIAILREDGLVGALREVGNLAGQAGEKILGFGQKVLDAIANVDWAGVARDLLDGLLGGLRAVVDFGSRFVSWVADELAAIDWAGEASAAGRALLDGIITGFNTATDFGGRVASWVADKITNTDWTGTASSAGAAILDGIVAGWEATTGYGGRFVDWFVGQLTDIDYKGTGAAILDGIVAGWNATVDFGSRFVNWFVGAFTGIEWKALGQTILDGIVTGWNTVTGWGQKFIDWFVGAFTSVDWSALGKAILDGIITGWNTITDWGQRAVDWIVEAFGSVDWNELGKTILDGIRTGWESAKDWGQKAIDWIAEQLRKGDWSQVSKTITEKLNEALGGSDEEKAPIIRYLQPLFDLMAGQWGEILNNFVQIWDNLNSIFGDIGRTVAESGQLSNGLKIVGGLIGSLVTVLALQKILTFTEYIKEASGAVAFLTGVAAALVDYLTGDWTARWNTVKDTLGAIWSIASGIPWLIQLGIDTAKTTLKNAISGSADSIQGFWDSTWDAIKGKASDIWSTATSGIPGVVKTGINDVKSALVGVLKGGADTIQGIWDSTWDALLGKVQTVIDTVKRIVSGVINSVNSVIGSINSALTFSVSVPPWVPVIGGSSWSFAPNLPYVPNPFGSSSSPYAGGSNAMSAGVDDPSFLGSGALPGTGGGVGGGGGTVGARPPGSGGGVGTGGGVKEPTHPYPEPGVGEGVSLEPTPPYDTLQPNRPSTSRAAGAKGGVLNQEEAAVAAALVAQGVPATVAVAAAMGASSPGSSAGASNGAISRSDLQRVMRETGLSEAQVLGYLERYGNTTDVAGLIHRIGNADYIGPTGLAAYKPQRTGGIDEWFSGGGFAIHMDGHRVGWLTGRRHMQGKQMRRSPVGC